MLSARARPFVLPVLVGVLTAMAPFDVYAQSEAQPEDTRSEESPSGSDSEEAPAVADAPSRVSIDQLVKESYLRRTEDVPPPLEPPPLLRSLWAVELGFGVAFGGDEVFFLRRTDGTTERVLAAGDGGCAFIGTTLTPFRAGRQSAGLGLQFGTKGRIESLERSDARVAMIRYPLVVYARYGYDIGADWSVVTGGGFQVELGVNAHGTGELSELDRDLFDAVGGIVQAGIIWESSSFASELFLRYTGIEYDGPDFFRTVDGNSFGIFYVVHLNLLRTAVTRFSR